VENRKGLISCCPYSGLECAYVRTILSRVLGLIWNQTSR